jgi:hypothetical protein
MSKSARAGLWIWVGLFTHWILMFTLDSYSDSKVNLVLPITCVIMGTSNLLLMNNSWWRRVPVDD